MKQLSWKEDMVLIQYRRSADTKGTRNFLGKKHCKFIFREEQNILRSTQKLVDTQIFRLKFIPKIKSLFLLTQKNTRILILKNFN